MPVKLPGKKSSNETKLGKNVFLDSLSIPPSGGGGGGGLDPNYCEGCA